MTFRAITGKLQLRTALHVGTGEGTEIADDLLRRDARGRLLIPGTAIAGALRSMATRIAPRLEGQRLCQAIDDPENYDAKKACQCLVCRLFGDVNPQEDEDAATSARILVYDAALEVAPPLHIRDGVGIDRVAGAAARRERIKFDLEVLPAGTAFNLRIEIDRHLQDDQALQLLAATLAEWHEGRGVVGGRVSRGLGAFVLANPQFIKRDLNQPTSLMKVLRQGPWDGAEGDTTWIRNQVAAARTELIEWKGNKEMPVARSWAIAEFTLAAVGPFLTHDLVQAGRSGFDHAPILATYQTGDRPVLPGSSLRGVLRSQAERIARTLATHAAWGDEAKTSSARQTDFLATCPACNPLTTKTDDPTASCNSFIKTLDSRERRHLEQQGAEDKLCLACRLFGSTWNGSRLRVEDAPFVGESVSYKVLDFLAIDRFTGGGRDSAKFDAAVLWKPRFRVRLFLENPQPWELGWLTLVLHDLNDGLATVGFGRAKGFGECRIEDSSLTFGMLHDTDFPILQAKDEDDVLKKAAEARDSITSAKSVASGLYQTVAYDRSSEGVWLALANGWVKAFNSEVSGHASSHTRTNDSYFTQQAGHWLSDLYPARMS